MKNYTAFLLLLCCTFITCKPKDKEGIDQTTILDTEVENKKVWGDISIDPIEHATTIIEWKDKTIYIDPNGGAKAFRNKKMASIVLITDIHGDHMNIDTLDSLDLSKAKIVVPQAVAEKLPARYTDNIIILNNGETKEVQGISIEAIPMYNLREEALKYHSKGRGNGYVLTLGSERVYFSGDTEDIPEMRALKDIDLAFICMNLPYTMPVKRAADAVLAFKPKRVYPYHYRGPNGYSDVSKFKELVAKNTDIEVVQLEWYPNKS